MPKLKVAEARKDDVFEDVARINHAFRTAAAGARVEAGAICRITVGRVSALAIVRGLPAAEGPLIRLDDSLRERLSIRVGEEVDLKLSRVGFWGSLIWAWHASDPAYRIGSRLAVLSVVLGFVGFLLGMVSLFT